VTKGSYSLPQVQIARKDELVDRENNKTEFGRATVRLIAAQMSTKGKTGRRELFVPLLPKGKTIFHNHAEQHLILDKLPKDKVHKFCKPVSKTVVNLSGPYSEETSDDPKFAHAYGSSFSLYPFYKGSIFSSVEALFFHAGWKYNMKIAACGGLFCAQRLGETGAGGDRRRFALCFFFWSSTGVFHYNMIILSD
jgi:hypothetical protein